MAWIESHQELGRHPKTLRAARRLGVSRVAVVGHLHYLWWWCLDYAADGDLSGFTCEEIADAAEWQGDASDFVVALGESGFLDQHGDRLTIHDNEDYNGKLRDARDRNRDRQREWRERKKTVTVTSPLPNGYVTGLPYPTVPNPTEHHHDAHAPAKNGADDDDDDDFYPTYETTLGAQWSKVEERLAAISPEFTDRTVALLFWDVEREVGPLPAAKLKQGLEASCTALQRKLDSERSRGKPVEHLVPYASKLFVQRLKEVSIGNR